MSYGPHRVDINCIVGNAVICFGVVDYVVGSSAVVK